MSPTSEKLPPMIRHADPELDSGACATIYAPYVAVADGRQGNGVGRELYAALIGLLRRQGLHVALAGITQPNAASVALHRMLGYEQVGTYRRIGYKAGAWRDVSWWQLVLSDGEHDGQPTEPLAPQRLP